MKQRSTKDPVTGPDSSAPRISDVGSIEIVDSRPPSSGPASAPAPFLPTPPDSIAPREPMPSLSHAEPYGVFSSAPPRAGWRGLFDFALPHGGTTSPRAWVEVGYWRIAWALVALAVPVLILWGGRVDLVAAGAFAAITLVAWAVARRSFDAGVGFHLAALFPYWTWYVSLPQGLPHELGAGVAGHLILLVFPALTLVALWGVRGALAALLLGIGSALLLWPSWPQRAAAIYVFAVAVLMGTVFRRLSVQLANTHDVLASMAYQDHLTGIPNRRLLFRRARKVFASSPQSNAAVLSIGLNRFKAINDSLGHAIGDELLRNVAARLSEVVPKDATFARLGGDEFAVFLPNVENDDAPRRLAKAIIGKLREVFIVRGNSVHVGARVGVAISSEHGRDLNLLIRSADTAMNRAKDRGKSVDELSWQGTERVSERLVLEVQLRNALAHGEVTAHFQPIVRTSDGRVVGAEALVRWNDARRGQVPAGEIIAVAEECGLITEVDRHVCELALAYASAWAKKGWTGWVAVNLSAQSFCNPDLAQDVKQYLLDAGVAPERLVIEVTESRAMHDPEASASTLHRLKALGVGVALDDFGVGYSSLAYLKMFPVDHIKIDRYFVQGIGLDDRDEHLIEVVNELARKRGIAVLAEGIETEEQLQWLHAIGCDMVQGYLLGRPMAAEDFERECVGPARPRLLRPSAR